MIEEVSTTPTPESIHEALPSLNDPNQQITEPTPTIHSSESTQETLKSTKIVPNGPDQETTSSETTSIATPPSCDPLVPSPPPPVSSVQSIAKPVQVPETSILTPFKQIQPLQELGKTRFMPGCFVHNTAKLGKNVYVGIFVYVGVEAEIGNNVVLLENVVVPPKVKIPDNCVVIPDPMTAELVEQLQDLESVNDNFKVQMQPKVDSILHNEK